MRSALLSLLVLAAAAACQGSPSPRQLDPATIAIAQGARLRTDTIGDGQFAEVATFVLVDARNTGSAGAYVTLGGELSDGAGAQLGVLKPQSLWIPAGDTRAFALVDDQRKPRPTASAARYVVRGVQAGDPPLAHVDGVRAVPDQDRVVAQGTLVNDAARDGKAVVTAAFHDARGQLMTRPFSVVDMTAHASQGVQFVGPPGSTQGTIFVGDVIY
jgi:hypothetical protein